MFVDLDLPLNVSRQFVRISTHLDCLFGLYWTGLTLLNGVFIFS